MDLLRLPLAALIVPITLMLVGCPPTRTGPSGVTGDCTSAPYVVSVETRDTGMGVEVCVWVENTGSQSLTISTWQEWDISLCGGQPNDLTRPDDLSPGIEIGSGGSAELLGWSSCVLDDSTTQGGAGAWEPSLVFYVSPDTADDTCWSEVRSPRLDGFYCEG